MVNIQSNSKKSQLIKGKIAKSSVTFRKNKPNSPIVQMNVTNLTTMNYTIFISLTKVKNKPNQTQYKANSNPILPVLSLCPRCTVEVISLDWRIDNYGKIFTGQKM